MKNYLDVMQDILENGNAKKDRTGTGTLSVFGRQMRFNIFADGFPLVTTKKTHLRSIIYELLWFLKGSSDNKWLNENNVTIWDEWADEDTGYLGPIYGFQWRSWPNAVDPLSPHDQICTIINQLRNNPDDRRIIVSAWNVDMLADMRLPPCHLLFQFYSHELPDGRRALSCQLYQRSCDWFLGVPFNIASYAMLTMMVAQVTDHVPYEFIWTGGDCHLYLNHLDQAKLQLVRPPRQLPWMCLNKDVKEIDDFQYEDFKLIGYDPYPAIKAPISV